MGELRGSTLQYGHLGTATYLPDLQTWEFSRKIGRESRLRFLGHTKIDAPTPHASSAWNTPVDGRRSDKTDNILLKAHPELASGLSSFGRFEQPSRSITNAVSTYDPQVSALLAIGNATRYDDNRGGGGRTVPIAAFVSAHSPGCLQLAELEHELLDWPPEKSQHTRVPRLRHQERASWRGPGGPVHQVCFAETIDKKSTWLAARFARSTIVLRPLCGNALRPVQYDGRNFVNGVSEDTRLAANPIADIPINVTGGNRHAAVAFNPWYPEQIAIIDCQGNWSVWNLKKEEKEQMRTANWHLERVSSGSLFVKGEEDVEKPTLNDHYDGWATITWAGDVNEVLMCDRRTIALFRIGSDPVDRCSINLGLQRPSEWILDIKRSQSDMSHVFVLTTARIFWLSTSHDSVQGPRQGSDGVSILLSWRHFRDSEDTSLQLASLFVQSEFSLILYSRLNNLAQVFRFGCSTEDGSTPIPVSVADPSLLELSPVLEATEDPVNAHNVPCLASMLLQEIPNASMPYSQNYDRRQVLVKFFGQLADSRLVEALYTETMVNEQNRMEIEEYGSIVSQRRVERSRKWVDDEDFVVDDLGDRMMNSFELQSGIATLSRKQSSQTCGYTENWEALYSSTCSEIHEFVGTNRKSKGPDSGICTFGHWLEAIRDGVENVMLDEPSHCQTMYDIVEETPSIDDVDKNSQDFGQLLSQDTLKRYGCTLPLPSSSASDFSNAIGQDRAFTFISGLYDSLIHAWVSPLPGEIPIKVRISKEKLIRVIVAQLVASRITIVRNETTPDVKSASTQDSNDPMESQPPSSFLEPTSSQLTKNMSDLDVRDEDNADAESSQMMFATLLAYTSFKDQAPLPRRVTNTLSHWNLGSNPSTYDWQATVSALQEEEESQSEGEQKAREKRRRREERKKKQRRAQLEKSSSKKPPAIKMWGSQPQAISSSQQPPGGLKSSQVTEEDLPLPMSQVERGVFGSRDSSRRRAVKERKKKRAAGF